MNKYDDIKVEIQELINEGDSLKQSLSLQYSDRDKNGLPVSMDLKRYFFLHYEVWYSKALAIIKQLMPDRVNDFTVLYRNEKRKEFNRVNYTISDVLAGVGHLTNGTTLLTQQIMILRACLDKFDSKVYDLHTLIEADVFDSEIESAKHLHKLGYLRAAGAICGVIIEKHFKGVADAHNIAIKKKNPTIADYNDKFKDVVYDTIEWRRIQRLGDLRNLCDHNKDREPTADEVTELISGTERTIKTIF